MMRFRLFICAALVVGVLVPSWSGPAGMRRAQAARSAITPRAAAPQVVWHVGARTFDPRSAQDSLARTFTARSAVYLVEIELSGTNGGDEVYVQLGDNQDDATQVRRGEDRFFTASNLTPGAMPTFRVIADPKHSYGGRTVTYAVAVYAVPALPLSVSGVAVSTAPNVVAFTVSRAGPYTVHYHLDSGTAHLIVINKDGATVKDFGTISGDGGVAARLPAGVLGLGLEQTPAGTPLSWTLGVGVAPIVGGLSPADRAELPTAPRELSAVASPGARLVLDNRTIGGSYDAARGRVVYRPSTPLAAGLHELAVAGADGTLAVTSAHFLVLPPAVIPAASPAGAFAGLSFVRTATPDGRYTLLKPASWRMVGSGGIVALSDPRGSTVLILSERYLGTAVDALSIARQVGAALAGHYGMAGAWRYSGDGATATFAGTLAGAKSAGPVTTVGRVLPSLSHNSLLLAFGFSPGTGSASAAGILAHIEGSLSSNDTASLVAARPMLHYAGAAVSLAYPAGWVANFTNPSGSWFIGPNDQAVMIALGLASGGQTADASALHAAGRQVQAYVRSQIHGKLTVLQESSAAGLYRWLATWPSGDGKTVGIEVGEVVAHNGQTVAVFGDTALEQAPTNLPVFGHSLDSAARAAGVTPSGGYTMADAAAALRTYTATASSNGSNAQSGVTPAAGRASKYLSAYHSALSSHAAYQSVLDMSYTSYAASMNSISALSGGSYTYSYTRSY